MIDRTPYKKKFTKDNIPNWICPSCLNGVLHSSEKHFISEDTGGTKRGWNEEWFDPEMAMLTYTAMFTCTNSKCQESVASSGYGYLEQEYFYNQEGQHDYEYVAYYRPLFFHPTLQIFKIPNEAPESVKKAIENSFSTVLINKSASANQVRIAVECLLTHLKIKQFNVRIGRRRQRLNLHQRIELLPVKYKKIKDICLAIKWLGNAGSHCDEDMKIDDVFDGYDMLSFVLEELFDNKHVHVKKLAKKINTKKGV
ncbi:DUF4145 domain-containing protein [Sulfurimonas sp.]|uniref:DUF4145 domain-containing protein n=1 Tax=Sulfurimonas sp. TaxID=2022749 RepID=UPI0026168B05|nr:DUF4145 domain-containing protein [Sulfurimonas sp.]MCW8895536.1 DUF4145 domain-containing protein [Sulfurimonas sp.]MCW9067986.1 DUF4145 domain-containing protein [Sulfurimonas sp.]